jgi:hypothetical protein
MQVSATNHGYIFRNAQPGGMDNFHCADGHRIIEAEHSVRKALAIQQNPHGSLTFLRALRINVESAYHKIFVVCYSARAQCFTITLKPLHSRACLASSDVRDSPTANVNQVLGSHSTGGVVVNANKICLGTWNVSVNQHE